MRAWETDLLRYMETSHPELGRDIVEKKRISDENQAALHEAIKTFNSTWIG
jgi:F-type H+-transporting ATPase subunit alpha